MAENRSDRFTGIEEYYEGYNVYDVDNERIGKVDDLFVNESDETEYIGVKMGFLGTKSTLMPWELVRSTDENNGRIEVSVNKATAKDAPAFDDDQEITPEFEQRVHSHYGLQYAAAERGSYDAYYTEGHHESDLGHTGTLGEERGKEGAVGPGMAKGDTESGEFRGDAAEPEGVSEPGSDLEDEDELRVQRSEEELRAGTREREAGKVNVRKRVRTDRERMEVPTRREEVHVDRVPASGEASETEIGEEEIDMPVTEEEVVTEKKAEKKEEIRVRKEAVEETETVEEDVRKEEVDVEDTSEHRER